MMIIRVLIENEKNEPKSDLKCEHGLSLHIVHNGKNILFDTGATGAFMENARAMNIDMSDIDIVVLSHAHKDHAGGLVDFLKANKKAKVYMSANADRDYFIRIFFKNIDVSVPKELFEYFKDRICFVEDFTKILHDVYLIPNSTERFLPLGRSSKNLFVKEERKYRLDEFDHELTMVINNNNKLVVFTACSHGGLTNMVEHAMRFFPSIPVQAVIGGFHLMGIPFKKTLGESIYKSAG